MFDPVLAWHEEHVYFGRLLRLLQEQVDLFHDGGSPDYGLMQDIISYLTEYADVAHHPREDEAFTRLLRKRPALRGAIARLEQEHRVIAMAGDALSRLLQEVVAGDAILRRAEVEMAAATFLVYYGNHIAKEEEDVLPAARVELDAEDWAAVKAAAPLMQDPVFGRAPAARFKALRHRIEHEAAVA